jgi:site-specific recombinase XerD
MWFEERAGRELPFIARWRYSGGKKDSRSFKTESERADFAKAWSERRTEHGRQAVTVHPKQLEVWQEFDARTGGADPLKVADFWVKMRGVAGGNLTVAEGIKRFHEIRANRIVARDTASHRRLHLRRFAEHYGTRRLAEITPEVVRLWLFGRPESKPPRPPLLKNPDRADGVFSPPSLLHHLRSLALLFDILRRERLVDVNPCDAVEEPAIPEKERPVLTPRQAFDLFAANLGAPVSGPLAVECFGGLRFTSAARLTLDRIKTAQRGLILPGVLHKSRRRKYRQGHPLNLWAWLDVAPAAAWDYDQTGYRLAKRAAFVAAGLKPAFITDDDQAAAVREQRNILRYSFASYLLALTKDAPLVARLMQHKHTSTTEIYEGVAEETDAVLFFSLTPDTVALGWAGFLAHCAGVKAADLMPAD